MLVSAAQIHDEEPKELRLSDGIMVDSCEECERMAEKDCKDITPPSYGLPYEKINWPVVVHARFHRNNRCYYCKDPIEFKETTNTGNASADHIIPKLYNKGDQFRLSHNKIPACLRCNGEKDSRLPSEWAKYIKEQMAFAEKHKVSKFQDAERYNRILNSLDILLKSHKVWIIWNPPPIK